MSEDEKELFREWVQAEIQSALEAIDEDSEGYRGFSKNECRNAEKLWIKVKLYL
jgi:hypothetical protein